MTNARTRLVLANVLLSTALTAAVLGLAYASANRTIANETRGVVNAELAGLSDDYGRQGILGLIRAIDRRLSSASDRDALYLLTDPQGRVLAGNLAGWPPTVPPGGGWVELDLIRTETDASVPVSAASIRLAGGERLLVGRDASARRQFDRVLMRSGALALVAALVLSLLTGWLLTRLVFSRLSDIRQTAGDIVSGDLTRRIPLRGTGDEFDQVAETLNHMLDRIEDLVGNLRVTTNAISHDLRSPLGRLRQRIEALAGPGREEDTGRALAEVDHLLRVFSQLTDISRAEAGLGRAEFEPVDPLALAREIADFYEPLAAERAVRLEVAGESGPVTAHRALLSRALSNLLENALRYAPDGSVISLQVAGAAQGVSITVRDRGPGVGADAIARLDQPFVTLDPSRGDGNSGLGLALVAAIARLHGGRFVAVNRDPGLEVGLTLAR